MNSNAIIDLLSEGMPIVNSAINSVVGALVTTLFVRKNTRAEEFEKIKIGKFNDVIEELLDNGKMTYLEYYKCNNFLKIAKLADEHLLKDQTYEVVYNSNQYDFDWFVKFYDYASNISNDDMQNLWALIFKNEVKSPGTTSVSLMHTLSMMRFDQAKFFCNISRFALRDAKTNDPHLLLFVSSNREAYRSSGITPSALKELEHLGLMECDFASEYVFLHKKVMRTGNKIITIYGDPDNKEKIKAGNVVFTRDGQLLYSIIDDDYKKYRSDILDFTIKKFLSRNCQVEINGTHIM